MLPNIAVIGNILTGSVVYQIKGAPEQVRRTGDVFFESQDVRIGPFDAQRLGEPGNYRGGNSYDACSRQVGSAVRQLPMIT